MAVIRHCQSPSITSDDRSPVEVHFRFENFESECGMTFGGSELNCTRFCLVPSWHFPRWLIFDGFRNSTGTSDAIKVSLCVSSFSFSNILLWSCDRSLSRKGSTSVLYCAVVAAAIDRMCLTCSLLAGSFRWAPCSTGEIPNRYEIARFSIVFCCTIISSFSSPVVWRTISTICSLDSNVCSQ